jgi:hypothetical protein
MIVIVSLVRGGHARVSHNSGRTGGSVFEKLAAARLPFVFLGHAQLLLRSDSS